MSKPFIETIIEQAAIACLGELGCAVVIGGASAMHCLRSFRRVDGKRECNKL
jgi:hypothetical protein